MKSTIECPFCDGMAHLHRERRDLEYRHENFVVMEVFYACDACGETFTTTESDNVSVNQLYAQYRAKHSIPFPEELMAMRLRYGLSARRLSQLLGFGDNSYRQYENGTMPTLANANLLRTAMGNPKEFYRLAEDQLSDDEKNRLIGIAQRNTSAAFINTHYSTNDFTGFRYPNLERIGNLLLYFLPQSSIQFNSPLKLNKVLFYADFACFKNTGRSLTGLSYRAIQHGPVPSCYDNLFAELKNHSYLQSDTVESGDNLIEIYKASKAADMSVFTETEQQIIDNVVHVFANVSTKSIRDTSHEERAWKNHFNQRDLISYSEYAFDLKAI